MRVGRSLETSGSSAEATSIDIALATLHRLGGATRYVDIEELTIEAYRVGPQLFRWRTRREYPSPEKVRMALVHANERRAEPLVVSNAKGLAWRLTSAGVAYVDAAKVGTGSRRSSSSLSSPSARRVREIRRHPAYVKFAQGTPVADIERYQLADLLLCPPDSSAVAVMRKADAARAAALDIDDKDIERFLGEVAKEVEHKWS
jgi:hypothetical protein